MCQSPFAWLLGAETLPQPQLLPFTHSILFMPVTMPASSPIIHRERERELRKEGREVPSRVRLREGPIGVRITLGQPTIG